MTVAHPANPVRVCRIPSFAGIRSLESNTDATFEPDAESTIAGQICARPWRQLKRGYGDQAARCPPPAVATENFYSEPSTLSTAPNR